MGLLDESNEQVLKPAPAARNPADVLMQVEVPVSVSLGRTRMRMKDLLSLTHGSVVELDEYVGDEVEILVNKCVLAHGEVVAIDGNYGVRITRLGSGGAPPAVPESPSPEEAHENG